MTFEEKELELLRKSVDIAEKKLGKKIKQSNDVDNIIKILEDFLRRKKVVCYGGTAINNIFGSVKFWPNTGVTGNLTAQLTVASATTTWANRTLNFVGTTANVPANVQTSVSITNSGTWTPSLAQSLYCRANVMLVGGGGAGGSINSQATQNAGGGAGGEVANIANISIPFQQYNVVIGSGGIPGANANGGAGAPTSIVVNNTLYTAMGGNGGITIAPQGTGGSYPGSPARTGGTGNIFLNNTTGSNVYLYAGGGGAGAGANGGNASQIIEFGTRYGRGGKGGNGIQSNISGTSSYYSGGGGGIAGLGTRASGSQVDTGGGGSGGTNQSENALTTGRVNSGGGGGAIADSPGDWPPNNNGTGGSGIIVIKFYA